MTVSPNKQFAAYIAKYLGIALIAGSIVHMGTLDTGTMRYFILLAIGVVLTIFGNIQDARVTGQNVNGSYLGIIVGLSLATGLLSGGVQHYLDNPSYAGWLLGIGVFVTYVTFFWKEKFLLSPKSLIIVGLCAAAIVLVSLFAVEQLLTGAGDGHTDHVH